MSASQQLRQLLQRRLLGRPAWTVAATDSEVLPRLLAARQALAPPRGRHALPRIAQGVLAFRLQHGATRYPDLKYACYGLARPTDWEGRLLIDDERLCGELLAAVTALRATQAKAYAACCRALRQAQASDLSGDASALTPIGRRNRDKLAAFLGENPPAG